MGEQKTNNFLNNLLRFAYTKNGDTMEEMTKIEYHDLFINNISSDKIEATYKKAWEAKNFEIELYWKRANYFWAFQIASFAGYFTIIGSKTYTDNPQVLYFVICIGLITSMAWVFTNIGSKTWQRHWEIHVDMLEDLVTGPLYKTVTKPKTFSLSKINEIVSRYIATIWIIMIIKYFIEHVSFCFTTIERIDYQVWLSSISAVYFISAMMFGYGRGRFGERKIKFYKRKVDIYNDSF